MKIFKKRKKGFEIDNPLELCGQVEFSSNENEEDGSVHSKNRFFAWLVITIMFLVLLGRSFYLQVVQGAYYKDVAENNRIRETVIKAPRGIIKDRFGDILARNIPSFDVVFVPAYLPKDLEARKILAENLSKIINQNQQEIEQIMEKPAETSRENFLLKGNIEDSVAYELIGKSQSFPGIYIGKTAMREYEDGKYFSHIIGYEGKITESELEKNPEYLLIDNIGKDGLEYAYEKYLHGYHGAHRYEVDSNNNIKEDLGMVNPKKGDELVLNIDAGLQRKIFDILENILKENKDATGAAVVAIDPRDGGVRALASVPGYDNNMFAKGITANEYDQLLFDQRKPLLNRAIAGLYPPGSIFKPFVAAAALEEGVISESTKVNCQGIISIGEWSFPDWKTHGITDVKKAIAESCDVFFYAVAGGWNDIPGLGITRIEQYGKLFGLGSVIGIDLPGESDGNLPNENWKFKTLGEKWYIGDSYHAGIGQGYVTATPLQMANTIAIIANGGTFYRPKIVHEIVDFQTGERKKTDSEVVASQIVSAETLRIIQEGMRQTVIGPSGSARSLGTLAVTSAGKTGTAQFGNEDKTHSWYASFAPYENPEIAMVVLIEGGGEGHGWAVPVTKETYQWLFDQQRGTVNLDQETDVSEKESSEAGEDASVSESH